jgi:DNA/RNA endonuclease G (NUC1)
MVPTNMLKEIINFMVSNLMVRTYLTSLLIVTLSCTKAQVTDELRDSIYIQTPIYQVTYSETKEQPIQLTYLSSNRVKNVDRGSMNFYTDKEIHTSDNADYYRNVWDKGHLAPAATFSDSRENLRMTFSYLNCALQNQYLNRGAWRLLEEQERKWDDQEELKVTIKIEFSDSILPTGATIPSKFTKCIEFTDSNNIRCYSFPNEKPTKGWEEYEIEHDQN